MFPRPPTATPFPYTTLFRSRAKRRGLLRNAAVALGNSENPDAVPPLAAALADPEPLVRAHAAWALGRLGGARAPAADRKSTRLNSSHTVISYAVFCLKKKST